MVQLERFYARFDEEWKVLEKCVRLKECELRLLTGESTIGYVSSDSSQYPPLSWR